MNRKEESPEEAARRLATKQLRNGFEWQALHVYTDQEGEPLYWRIRLKHPDTGQKWIRPMKQSGTSYVLGEPECPNGRPLYRLHEWSAADPSEPIFLVEGESCADALANLGVLATTSGSAVSGGKTDWTPLQRRGVVVWPDNDEAGFRYADESAEKLIRVGSAVLFIDVAALNLQSKGDAVDWLKANPTATASDIFNLPHIEMPEEAQRPTNTIELVQGSTLKPEPVEWIWTGWVAVGKVHILGGAPGTGKTTISMDLAATITNGGCWPDGSPSPQGDVVIWSGEDDPQDTLVPRLIAAGANMERIYFIRKVHEGDESRVFDPAFDLATLQSEWPGSDVKLLIVDPIVSAVSGDSNKNAEVRRSLQPLVDLAAAKRCAVLGITHFSKGTIGRDPLERLTGSLAFGALARVVFVAAKSGSGYPPRIFLRAKSNIGCDDGGFRYDLKQNPIWEYPGVLASSVVWGGSVEGSAREILNVAEESVEPDSALEEAKRFLSDLLADGPLSPKVIDYQAKEAGVSNSTLRRAKESLGVESNKIGMEGGWAWSLPRRGPKDAEAAQPQGMGIFEEDGYLRQTKMQEHELLNQQVAGTKLGGRFLGKARI